MLSGKYDDLFNFVIFGSWILYAMATASVFVLRRKRPDLNRPYKTLGYPVVPVLFLIGAAALELSTLRDRPAAVYCRNFVDFTWIAVLFLLETHARGPRLKTRQNFHSRNSIGKFNPISVP